MLETSHAADLKEYQMTVTIAPPIAESTRHFSSTTRALLINGKFELAASGKTFDTLNPATGEVLASVAEGDAEDRSSSAGRPPRLRGWPLEPNDTLRERPDYAPHR